MKNVNNIKNPNDNFDLNDLLQPTLSLSAEHEFFLCECATIKEFLKNGIDTIRGIDFPNEGKLLNAMFSLSQGYERFLKIVYAQMYDQINNRYPTNDEFKKLGHNVNKLFEEVINFANQLGLSNEYLAKIENKEEPYVSIINILSDFASMLRYYNFTMLTSNNKNQSPVCRWHSEVEEKVIQNKNIYFDIKKLGIAEEMDRNDIGISLFYDYDKNKITTFKEQYIIGKTQCAISKYTKMYLCHIVKALCGILYEMPNGYMYNEFFWCFSLGDIDLRNRKTLRP